MPVPNKIQFVNPEDKAGMSEAPFVEVYTDFAVDQLIEDEALARQTMDAALQQEIADEAAARELDVDTEQARAEAAEADARALVAAERDRALGAEADLDTNKLDKVVTAAQETRVYGITNLGNQTVIPLAITPIAGEIPQYNVARQLRSALPTVNSPSDTVVNKAYADTINNNLQRQIDDLSSLGRFLGGVETVDDIPGFELPAKATLGDYITVAHDTVNTSNNGSTRWKLIAIDPIDPRIGTFEFDLAYDTDISGKVNKIPLPEVGHIALITPTGEISNGPDPVIFALSADVINMLQAHIDNTTMHITAMERAAWNGHVLNGEIHVSNQERVAWNAKQNTSSITNPNNLLTYDNINKILVDSGIDKTTLVTAGAGLPFQILSKNAAGTGNEWVDKEGGYATGVVPTRQDLPQSGDYEINDYIFVQADDTRHMEASMYRLKSKLPTWQWEYLLSFPGSGEAVKTQVELLPNTFTRGAILLYRYGRQRQLVMTKLGGLAATAWTPIAQLDAYDVPDLEIPSAPGTYGTLVIRAPALSNVENSTVVVTPVPVFSLNHTGLLQFRPSGPISTSNISGITTWFV